MGTGCSKGNDTSVYVSAGGSRFQPSRKAKHFAPPTVDWDSLSPFEVARHVLIHIRNATRFAAWTKNKTGWGKLEKYHSMEELGQVRGMKPYYPVSRVRSSFSAVVWS
jgi:hypothetical protein